MSDADLTQYNGTAAFPATADVGTNADMFLVPTDDKVITSLSNIAGEAPVRRSLDRVKDLLLGLRGAVIGDFLGAVRKTMKSLAVDGVGGNTSTTPAGSLTITGATGTGTTVPTTAYDAGTMFRDSVCLGHARGYWDGANMVLVRGYNVRNMVRNGAGDYSVTFQPVVSAATTATAQVTLGLNPSVIAHGFVGNVATITDDGAGRVVVQFVTIDPNTASLLDTSALSNFYVELRAE